ncbi:unnamed protein product, partial [Closterium sp. Naga37s-1]
MGAREWPRGPVVLCHVAEHSRGGSGACSGGHDSPGNGRYEERSGGNCGARNLGAVAGCTAPLSFEAPQEHGTALHHMCGFSTSSIPTPQRAGPHFAFSGCLARPSRAIPTPPFTHVAAKPTPLKARFRPWRVPHEHLPSFSRLSPLPATAKQLVDEVRAVKGVSKRLCPLRVSLDRVILTATGVLLACWQVVEGTDPAELRDAFKEALPRAPKQQLYNQVMLHTSLARIIAPPTWPDGVYMCAASTYPSFDSSQHLHHPCGRTG